MLVYHSLMEGQHVVTIRFSTHQMSVQTVIPNCIVVAIVLAIHKVILMIHNVAVMPNQIEIAAKEEDMDSQV